MRSIARRRASSSSIRSSSFDRIIASSSRASASTSARAPPARARSSPSRVRSPLSRASSPPSRSRAQWMTSGTIIHHHSSSRRRRARVYGRARAVRDDVEMATDDAMNVLARAGGAREDDGGATRRAGRDARESATRRPGATMARRCASARWRERSVRSGFIPHPECAVRDLGVGEAVASSARTIGARAPSSIEFASGID